MTPQEQLRQAQEAAAAATYGDLSYNPLNTATEEAGIANAQYLNQIPSMIGKTAISASMLAGMIARTAKADRLLSLVDPFTGLMGRHMVGASIGKRLLGAVPGGFAFAAMMGGGEYIANRMTEGQQDFVATRQLMRELSQGGYGGASILAPPAGLATAAGSFTNVQGFQQTINSLSGGLGINNAQARNLVAGMQGSGMLGGVGSSSDIRRVSETIRARAQELKTLSENLNTDIGTVAQMYAELSRQGFSTPGSRAATLTRMGQASTLTGISMPMLAHAQNQAVMMGSQLGISAGSSANMAMNSLGVSAVLRQQGMIDPALMAATGGDVGALASADLHRRMAAANSGGALTLMFGHRNADGSLRDSMGRGPTRLSYSRQRQIDPYSLAEARDTFTVAAPELVLGEVARLRGSASSSRQANRRQFEFLASMGINDPTEQLRYLQSLRNQQAGDFALSAQGTVDALARANVNGPESLEVERVRFSDVLSRSTETMRRSMQAYGTAVLQMTERVSERLERASMSLSTSSTPGFNVYTASVTTSPQAMNQVRNDVLSGRFSMSGVAPLSSVRSLLGRPEAANVLGRSDSVLGFTYSQSIRDLPALARGYANLTLRTSAFINSLNPIERARANLNPALAQGMFRDFYGGRGLGGESNTGGLGQMIRPEYLSDVQSNEFPIRAGYGRYMSADQYMAAQLALLGLEYDPATQSSVRANGYDVDRLVASRSSQIDQVVSDIRNAQFEQNTRRLSTGTAFQRGATGYIWNQGIAEGGTVQSMLNSNSVLGEAGGLALSATLGFGAILGGAYDTVRGIGGDVAAAMRSSSSNNGVQVDTTLSEEQIRLLRNDPRQQMRYMQQISQSVYGDDYSNLSSRQRVNLVSAISREAPDIAQALNFQDTSNLSDAQASAQAAANIAHQALTTVFAPVMEGREFDASRAIAALDAVSVSEANRGYTVTGDFSSTTGEYVPLNLRQRGLIPAGTIELLGIRTDTRSNRTREEFLDSMGASSMNEYIASTLPEEYRAEFLDYMNGYEIYGEGDELRNIYEYSPNIGPSSNAGVRESRRISRVASANAARAEQFFRTRGLDEFSVTSQSLIGGLTNEMIDANRGALTGIVVGAAAVPGQGRRTVENVRAGVANLTQGSDIGASMQQRFQGIVSLVASGAAGGGFTSDPEEILRRAREYAGPLPGGMNEATFTGLIQSATNNLRDAGMLTEERIGTVPDRLENQSQQDYRDVATLAVAGELESNRAVYLAAYQETSVRQRDYLRERDRSQNLAMINSSNILLGVNLPPGADLYEVFGATDNQAVLTSAAEDLSTRRDNATTDAEREAIDLQLAQLHRFRQLTASDENAAEAMLAFAQETLFRGEGSNRSISVSGARALAEAGYNTSGALTAFAQSMTSNNENMFKQFVGEYGAENMLSMAGIEGEGPQAITELYRRLKEDVDLQQKIAEALLQAPNVSATDAQRAQEMYDIAKETRDLLRSLAQAVAPSDASTPGPALRAVVMNN